MKKCFIYLFLLIFLLSAFSMANPESSAVRLKCKGDVFRKTKTNEVVGDVYVFTVKDGKIYDDEGKCIKNAVITEDNIKGIARYRNGLSLETIKFSINRYSGSFNYYRSYTTLEGKSINKNSGICEVIKNEKMF